MGTFGAEPSNMSDIGRISYEIWPSATDPKVFDLLVTVLGHEKQRIGVQVHGLYANRTSKPITIPTYGGYQETFKHLSYENNILGLNIRVYKCDFLNHNKSLCNLNGLYKATEIGEIQFTLKKNTGQQNTKNLKEMKGRPEPTLKQRTGAGSDSEDGQEMTGRVEQELQPRSGAGADSEDGDYIHAESVNDTKIQMIETEMKEKDKKIEKIEMEMKEKDRQSRTKMETIETEIREKDRQHRKDIEELNERVKRGSGMQPSVSNPTEKIDRKAFRVACNIKPPPKKVKAIHREIIKLIKTTLHPHGYELEEDGSGPTLVTIVDASRTQEDIERDMKAAKLSGSEASDVILLRIVPSQNPNIKVKKMTGEHYKLDMAFLAEQSAEKLHDCPQNVQACEEIIEYLSKNMIKF